MTDSQCCPVCNSGHPEIYFECEDMFLTHEKFNLARCPECGFINTHNPPDENAISKYYESSEYISHDDNSKGIVNTIYRAVRTITLKRKRSVVKKLTALSTGSILDIGSGTGYFLSEMKSNGWRSVGIEINNKAREFSVNNFRLEVLPPSGLKSLPDHSFDCITLWHVLEHFHDLETYIGEIRRLLKHEGLCFIALPNCSSFDAEYYGKFWAAYDVPRHLWHFTPSTFRKFASKNGFDILRISGMPADVFYISAVSEKYKGSRLSFLTGILKGFWFSLKTIFNKEKSSSLIYILNKSPEI